MSIFSAIRAWFGGKKKSEPEVPGLPEAASAEAEEGTPIPTGPIDFVTVLATAGIEPEVRDRVVKAKQLLRALPADAPGATKRLIVEAAFQAFEIPTQKIIHGASAEIDVLRSYIQTGEDDKTARLEDGERRIAELEGQIRDERTSMEQAVAAQDRRQRLTAEEIATVEPIVQFFAQEAIRSTAPPKGATDAKGAKAPKEAVPAKEAVAPKETVVSREASPQIDVDADPFLEPEYGVISKDDAGSGPRAKPVEMQATGVVKRSA